MEVKKRFARENEGCFVSGAKRLDHGCEAERVICKRQKNR